MFKPVSVLIMGVTLLFISFSSLAKADIMIIANKASSISSLEKNQAKKLWLGTLNKLPGVGRVKVVDQSNRNDIKEAFYEKLTQKTLTQLKVYWAKIIFTGRAVPHKSLSSDEKVLDLVRKNKNVLGYVDSKFVTDDVKVLMTIK